jgi:hypothetical protein
MRSTLFVQLERDWTALLDDPVAAGRLDAWRRQDNALAPYPSWSAALAAAHDRADPARADGILAALARRAPGDALAARVLLGMLLPGTRALAGRLWWLAEDEERAAAAVAAVWERIRTYPFARRPARIAANVLADARQRLTRAYRRDGAGEHVPLDGEAAGLLPAVPEGAEPTAGEELLELLRWATAGGHLTAGQARLIAESRLADVPCEVLGARVGLHAHSLRRRRQRAERALAVAVAVAGLAG